MEQVTELRLLLEHGAPTKADPRRPGFFELQGLQNVFYVFKYPTGAKVLLLGVWERDRSRKWWTPAAAVPHKIFLKIY